MGLFERNLTDHDRLVREAAGFAAMIVGLFAMFVSPIGIAICLVGLYSVAEGYYGVSVWSNLRKK
ncbi:MAG: DUF2892 domain-containing protein [Candidatus Altiarchaeales archaeon]|nr:DUF2892 domain-containing protein [Candidatus Altiarchaeales archaeon]MBD3416140.1 DUF2892 domain-containing protein [Candidatus Altiarchaeales archaeon]